MVNQIPLTFDDVTRQNIVPLTSQPYSSGGVSTFSLPTSGLGARLYLPFAGTLTNGGVPTVTATGPYSIFKRITIRMNSGVALFDCSGYGTYLLMITSDAGFDPSQTGMVNQGSAAGDRSTLFNYPTANNGAINFVLV